MLSETEVSAELRQDEHRKLRKAERRQQILLELKLHPHVRTSDLAALFGVSSETIRRDVDALSRDGLIQRAHGGATAPAHGHYPSLEERAAARTEERERIGRCAAGLVGEGETLMVDSGSTTIQFARSLAYLGTPCTVVTNSLPVAMALGHGVAEVILCPGKYLPAESAVVGNETVEFLSRFNVDRTIIGASSLSENGLSETVAGFAEIKRVMMRRAVHTHLLIDSEKFGRRGFMKAGELEDMDCIVVDHAPESDLRQALDRAKVKIITAT